MFPWQNWSFAFDDRLPIYRQIILQFNRAFVRGEVAPGDRIPSIRELSALLKVNTNTIQRAYQELEREGLVSSKRGTGYFLTEDESMTEKTRLELVRDSLQRFVEEMRSIGCADGEIIDELKSYMRGAEAHETGSGNHGA